MSPLEQRNGDVGSSAVSWNWTSVAWLGLKNSPSLDCQNKWDLQRNRVKPRTSHHFHTISHLRVQAVGRFL